MKPSKYQTAAITTLTETNKNILVNAKAGSGKTTLIKMMVKALTDNDQTPEILVLAFNKSIQTELQEKLGIWCEVRTCHSQGMRMLRSRGKVEVDTRKTRKAVQLLQNTFSEWRNLEADRLQAITKLSALCRLNLTADPTQVKALGQKHGIDIYAEDVTRVLQLCKVLQNDRNTVDFTDMVFQAAVYSDLSFPKYDYVFIDECQDLNVCQQKLMLKCLKPNGRFIAVGDPSQAIYGFAGADSESFDKLRSIENTVEMPLNECYRCGSAIIKKAQSIEPEIEAFEGNGTGEVVEDAKLENIEVTDMVLCRTNLPLVVLCYQYIAQGTKAYIKGKDIGASLAAYVKKANKVELSDFLVWAENDYKMLLHRLSNIYPEMAEHELTVLPSAIMKNEQIEILTFIIGSADLENCQALQDYLKMLFSDTNEGICLSSVHKSKGLEADRVWILEPWKMPSQWAKQSWEKRQERNLQYVAYTRAKNTLGFIQDFDSRSKINFDC